MRGGSSLERETIGPAQMALLGIPLVTGTGVLFVPGLMASVAGRDGWMAPLLAPAITGLLVLLLRPLLRRWPRQSFIQVGRRVLGPIPGGLLGLAFALWTLHVNSVVLRQYGEFVSETVLPTTPLPLIMLLFLVPVVLGARAGLEVLGRCAMTMVPVNTLFLVLILVLAARETRFGHLLPLLERGAGPVLRSALIPASWLGELVVLAFLWPRLQVPRAGPRPLLAASAWIGLSLAWGTLTGIAIFGTAVGEMVFPLLNVTRQVDIGQFLERIDPLVVVFWVGDNFLKVSLFHLVTLLALGQALGLRESRALAFPAGGLLLMLALAGFGNLSELAAWLREAWPLYGLGVELGVPAVTLLVALLWERRPGRDYRA